MDETCINHKQTPSQAKKAERIGQAAMAGGIASGRLSAVGVDMSAQRTEMYSKFSKVRKVLTFPSKNLIKVNGVLSHNQVYTCKEDFEFVKNYIISHCDNLK